MILVMLLLTLVVVGPIFYILIGDLREAAKQNGIMRCQLDDALIKYNRDVTDRTHRLTLTKIRLAVAVDALESISSQNAGQSTFEIWAKKRASDAVLRVTQKNEGLNPKGPKYL